MKRNLILSALVLLSMHCFGQYTWKNFNTSNSGLLSNNLSALTFTEDNQMWAAYTGAGGEGLGVVRFDGTTWTNFNQSNSGLPNNDIRAMASDPTGNMWFGCYNGGLVKYNGTTWTLYNSDNSALPDNNVSTLAVDNNGHLWVGMYFSGVSKFDGTNWTHFNHTNAPFPETNCINDIMVDEDINLWVGLDCQGGLAKRTSDGTWSAYTVENTSIPNHTVTAISQAADGKVWVGFLSSVISLFDGTNWINYNLQHPNAVAYDGFMMDQSGQMWCGSTLGGLLKFTGSVWEKENIPGIINETSIVSLSVAIDQGGSVWWGEMNNGLWKREEGPYAYIPDPNFRACLKENYPSAFTGSDSLILQQASSITAINCAGESVTDLTGVHYFKNLETLNVSVNTINNFGNLAGLSSLRTLECISTGISVLPDLSGSPQLELVRASNNALTAFPDFTANPNLTFIDVQNNFISGVPDLSYLPGLEYLYISMNPITTFPDLSQNTKLIHLDIMRLQVDKAPDLSAQTNLESISLHGNNWKDFPALNSVNLKGVRAHNNDLTELPDFSNTLLGSPGTVLELENNRLTFEDLLPFANREFFKLTMTPQRKPNGDSYVLAPLHQPYTMKLPFDDYVTSSVYEWYKDGSLLTTTNINELVIEDAGYDDSGLYHARITNPNIPDLIIQSGSVTLTITDRMWIADVNLRNCLKESYPEIFTASDSVLIDSAKAITRIECYEKEIQSLEGITGFANLTDLSLGSNNLTTVNELSYLTKLVSVQLSGNALEQLPDLSAHQSLTVLEADHNALTSLPSLEGTSIGTSPNSILKISHNHLSFEDLLPVVALSDYALLSYESQTLIPEDQMISMHAGETFFLAIGVDLPETGNTYRWYKDNEFFQTTDTDTITIENITEAHSGIYHCEITNTRIPGLMLIWEKATLNVSDPCAGIALGEFHAAVSPATCIAGGRIFIHKDGEPATTFDEFTLEEVNTGADRSSLTAEITDIPAGTYKLFVKKNNCELEWPETFEVGVDPNCDHPVISPNNDGMYDYYEIPFQGQIKIYNRAGVLVNQFAGPASWNGTDSSGYPVPMGLYIIVSDGQKEIAITIIR